MDKLPEVEIKTGDWVYLLTESAWQRATGWYLRKPNSTRLTEEEAKKLGLERPPEKKEPQVFELKIGYQYGLVWPGHQKTTNEITIRCVECPEGSRVVSRQDILDAWDSLHPDPTNRPGWKVLLSALGFEE